MLLVYESIYRAEAIATDQKYLGEGLTRKGKGRLLASNQKQVKGLRSD